MAIAEIKADSFMGLLFCCHKSVLLLIQFGRKHKGEESMEYNLTKNSIGYCSLFLDTVNEQIVDVDITLPDYCPDIEKILKCTLIPKIYTKKISAGQLNVDGVAAVRILYRDNVRHNIRSYEQTVPFSSTFNLKSTPEQYIVLVDTKCEYINCRALSPRKLVVHGAFSLYAKVLCKDTTEIYSYEEDTDLQVKLREVTASDLCAVCQEQFSFTQDIAVSSQPPVEALLSYDVSVNITDLKSIYNKIMLSAELTLRAMYLSDLDSGKVEHISYVFPVSRVIDCDGVSDDTVNVPYLEVMSYDLHIRNDALNDGSLLALDVKMCFCEIGYSDKQLSIIDDAYSTSYMIESKRSAFTCESSHSLEKLTHIIKSTVTLDSISISKVLDIYSESTTLSPIMSSGKLTLEGKSSFCILVLDAEGVPSYIERSVEIDFAPELSREFDRVEPDCCKVHSISYRLVDDNTLELRIELRVSLLLCNTVSANPLVHIQAQTDSPIERDDCSLILYFADKGETVWDIAKAYCTKESKLISENCLESTKLEQACMLLVPTE